MARRCLPLLMGILLIQLQYHTGHTQYTQYVEPYQSQLGVSTSFINTPVSSINPYSKYNAELENGYQTVDQTAFIQPYSPDPGTSQQSYSVQGQQLQQQLQQLQLQQLQLQQQQQQQQAQFVGGGQSSFVKQQPSVTYFTVTPETRTPTQQYNQPNFIYSTRSQEQQQQQLPHTIESSSVPIQREFVYPVGASRQTVRQPSQLQYTPSFVSPVRNQAAVPAASNEKFIPLSNLRSSFPENSEIITLGDSPFVITALKPKPQASVQVLQNGRNPLESLRSEAIIEALLNKGKNDGVRTNQIVVTTKSDNGRVSVTEAESSVPSSTPATEFVTETSTVSVTPTERTTPATSPMPTTTTTTTTTTPPPPPVHFEVTTTEERHYVSRKKKITVFIRVEDAGIDAEEKENYATKQDFHEWTKTIIEPTDVYDEKKTFLKNETREVEGPSIGIDVTRVICRNFVDDRETVTELDLLQKRAVCPRPVVNGGGPWEERAFRRIDSEVGKKLMDIFNISRVSVHPTVSSERSFNRIPSTPAGSTARIVGLPTEQQQPTSSGFLRQTIEAIQTLAPQIQERQNTPVTSKRDAEKPRHLVENDDLLADATEVNFSTDVSSQADDAFETSPNQTSKRETRPEVETSFPSTESHIMLITRTPPVRPPNPYHHNHSTTLLPDTELVPAPQALSSSGENLPSSHPEENQERTFFRRST